MAEALCKGYHPDLPFGGALEDWKAYDLLKRKMKVKFLSLCLSLISSHQNIVPL